MNQKTQDTFHWLLVVALTGTALEPSIKAIIPSKIDAILAVIFAGATLLNYYATTVQATTPPTPPTPPGATFTTSQ